MSNKNQQILEVIKCSENMLKHAETGNWEQVIDVEKQRNSLLQQLFSGSTSSKDIADITIKIHQILKINKKIEDLTSNVRNTIKNDISLITKGRQAVDFYAQNAG